jgi:hypothetical protein
VGKFWNDGREKLPTGIPEEDTERQVQDGDAIDCDESQGSSMNYKYGPGMIAAAKNFRKTIIWDDALQGVIDYLYEGEIATVVCQETQNGWVQLLSPRGIKGYIHRTNLKNAV